MITNTRAYRAMIASSYAGRLVDKLRLVCYLSSIPSAPPVLSPFFDIECQPIASREVDLIALQNIDAAYRSAFPLCPGAELVRHVD